MDAIGFQQRLPRPRAYRSLLRHRAQDIAVQLEDGRVVEFMRSEASQHSEGVVSAVMRSEPARAFGDEGDED